MTIRVNWTPAGIENLQTYYLLNILAVHDFKIESKFWKRQYLHQVKDKNSNLASLIVCLNLTSLPQWKDIAQLYSICSESSVLNTKTSVSLYSISSLLILVITALNTVDGSGITTPFPPFCMPWYFYSKVALFLGPERKAEAYANACRLRNLPKLSEWRSE